jgi:hypothetical protein
VAVNERSVQDELAAVVSKQKLHLTLIIPIVMEMSQQKAASIYSTDLLLVPQVV